MLREIIIAIQSYYAAHRFIRKNKLWKWIIIPGIIYMILFIVGFYFFIDTSTEVVNFIFVKLGVRHWMETHNQSVVKFLFLFGQVMLQLVLLLFYFSWFKYFFLVIGSPIFAFLSEKTESILLQKDFPFILSKFLKDVWRGIRIAFRNLFWQTLFTIAIILLSLVPVAGWIAPLLSLGIECYYLGFSMLDYTSERRGYAVGESIEFINKHKGLALGNGVVFYLLLILPLIGWVIAPGYAVVAATLSLQGNNESQNQAPLFSEH